MNGFERLEAVAVHGIVGCERALRAWPVMTGADPRLEKSAT